METSWRTKTIRTAYGSTSLKLVGNGQPIIVLHGGPGMSHDYLLPNLLSIANKHSLVFFDQLGCSEIAGHRPIDYLSTLRHAEAVVGTFRQGPICLLAHSWGACLAIELIAKRKILIDKCLYICPQPLTKARLDDALSQLRNRLSKEEIDALSNSKSTDGAQLMKVLFRHYFADPSLANNLPIPRCNLQTNEAVMASLANFNLLHKVVNSRVRTLVVLGGKDFIKEQHIRELIISAESAITLENVGHFPFIEDPNAFSRVVNEFLDQDS